MDNSTRNGIITVGVIAFLGIIAYKYLKTPTPLPPLNNGNSGQNNNGNNNGGNNSGNNSGNNGGVPAPSNLSNSQIITISNDIFEAMKGWGTDEDTILASFQKLKTNTDFDNLVSTFGTQTINNGYLNVFSSDFTGNLKQCLRNELSDGYISDINAILRSNRIDRTI